MHALLHIMLANAVGALLLAAVAGPVGWMCRKPAIGRAVWIIVLLKLFSPPIVAVPFDRFFASHTREVQQPQSTVVQVEATAPPFDPTPPRNIALIKPSIEVRPAIAWQSRVYPALSFIWLAGGILLFLVGMARVWMLARILNKAPLAPAEVQALARAVATRLGIVNPPGVWFVPGVICPALWAFGRKPRVIIPVSLWDRLDDVQRRTLLAHELAHYRRADHWVRLLEFAAIVLYWWHPAVWVARRQIHDFEEQCCDAWVLWAMPASAHSYGSALLEAVDFVATGRPMRPVLAAGLGEFGHLKRRLLMIKQGTVSRALSRTSLVAICSAAAFALPLAPGLAQESPPSIPPSNNGSRSENHFEIEKARAEVQQLQAELMRAQAELAEARSRLAVLEHGSVRPTAAGTNNPNFGGGGGSGGGSIPAGGTPPEAPATVANPAIGAGTAWSAVGYAGGGMMSNRSATAPPSALAGGGGRAMSGMGTYGIQGGGGGFGAAGRRDSDRRLDGLEAELRQLMDQVKELKAMQPAQHNNAPRPPEAQSERPAPAGS